MHILDLPFRERPILELLDLTTDRAQPNRDYTGFGWAKVSSIDLLQRDLVCGLDDMFVNSPIVIGVHAADRGEPLANDVELEFVLREGPPVTVLATKFLEKWLPELPKASAIVLAMCNPHHAILSIKPPVPLYYADSDVVAWLDVTEHGRSIRLATDGLWARIHA